MTFTFYRYGRTFTLKINSFLTHWQVIIGLVFTTVSSAPLDSAVPSEKPADSHKYTELIRPSPINPDIPMDPKPPERIILNDDIERDSKSLTEESPTVESEPKENAKLETKSNEPSVENNEEKKLNNKKEPEKSEAIQSDDKVVRIEQNHDVSNDGASKIVFNGSLNQPIKSDEPIIVYAVKADEKQRSESFQTSHRIPNIGETERQFQTSHHIPMHIDGERQKLIETSKVGEKSPNE